MYCLYIILHAGIIGLIIFLKPRLEPRLWAFSCCKPSPSPIQAHWRAGLGWGQTGWAWVGFGLWARPSTSLGGSIFFMTTKLLLFVSPTSNTPMTSHSPTS